MPLTGPLASFPCISPGLVVTAYQSASGQSASSWINLFAPRPSGGRSGARQEPLRCWVQLIIGVALITMVVRVVGVLLHG